MVLYIVQTWCGEMKVSSEIHLERSGCTGTIGKIKTGMAERTDKPDAGNRTDSIYH